MLASSNCVLSTGRSKTYIPSKQKQHGLVPNGGVKLNPDQCRHILAVLQPAHEHSKQILCNEWETTGLKDMLRRRNSRSHTSRSHADTCRRQIFCGRLASTSRSRLHSRMRMPSTRKRAGAERGRALFVFPTHSQRVSAPDNVRVRERAPTHTERERHTNVPHVRVGI